MVNHRVNIHRDEPLRPLGLLSYHRTPYPPPGTSQEPVQAYTSITDTWFYSLLMSSLSAGHQIFHPRSFFSPCFLSVFHLFAPPSSSLSLSASFCSFFENMARITSPDYVPTETDVLRVRLRTTGVIETQFKVNHLIFRYTPFTLLFIETKCCTIRVLAMSDWLGAVAIMPALDFSRSVCRTNLLHFPSRDTLISVYSHVICPRCEMEMGSLIQYVNMAPISWLYTHLVAAHTFKSISGSSYQWRSRGQVSELRRLMSDDHIHLWSMSWCHNITPT